MEKIPLLCWHEIKGIDFLRKLVAFTHKRKTYITILDMIRISFNHKEQIKNNIIWLTGLSSSYHSLNDKMEEQTIHENYVLFW